ncbi:MAG: DNA polymerase II [Alteromonadaceae bacterium]|nr:DNA polymerase II [Alteromonadaceae bacterium]
MDSLLKNGFLLTRQSQDQANGIAVTIWVKTIDDPIKLVIENELALFFIENSQVAVAKEFLLRDKIKLIKTKALSLKTFNQQFVTGFYFKFLRDFYAARECLKNNNIKCYEDDFRPDDRFLMERFITAKVDFIGQEKLCSAIIKGESSTSSTLPNSSLNDLKVNYLKYNQTRCKSQQFQLEKPNIKLSMVSVDIECAMEGTLYSIGIYSETCQIVFMIGERPAVEPSSENAAGYIRWIKDEKQLLHHFIHWLHDNDPDIIIGWNVINFDMVLLQQRCDLHGITFAIGRDGKPPYWRKNKISEQKYIEISGRVVLDGIDLLKTATYNFASFSLDSVSNTLLGIGKKVDDVDNRIQEITDNFNHDKPALAAYNLEDCRLVWLIFEKTQLLEFAILRAELTGLAIDRVGGSVAAFTNLYLPKLHRSGYVAPNMGDGESGLVSPGGYVMDSIPGLYDNVLVLDFKSLYPSIIRTFKIDPMGLIEGLLEHNQAVQADNADGSEVSGNDGAMVDSAKVGASKIDRSIEGFDGAYFSRDQHFLPAIIESLWLERDKAKQENNAALSQAIKIIMNSFYGVLGSNGCRFFDPRLSGSITKRSHVLLKTTKKWIEEKGYQVIYGDTDSIFVNVGTDKSLKNSRALGKELQNFINDKWLKIIEGDYKLTCHLEIEFETHFSKFLMPTIRGLDIGTKKRYAGLVLDDDNNQSMVFKGLESVRTDWTELSKMFQRELYKKVFNNQPVVEYILEIKEKTLSGEFDHLLIYRKRIRRKLSEYVKNVPPHVKAARIADMLNMEQGKPLKYQNKGWIEYYITLNGPQAREHLLAPLDYQFYIDRQLMTVADAILPFINTSFGEITDTQLNLFS